MRKRIYPLALLKRIYILDLINRDIRNKEKIGKKLESIKIEGKTLFDENPNNPSKGELHHHIHALCDWGYVKEIRPKNSKTYEYTIAPLGKTILDFAFSKPLKKKRR